MIVAAILLSYVVLGITVESRVTRSRTAILFTLVMFPAACVAIEQAQMNT